MSHTLVSRSGARRIAVSLAMLGVASMPASAQQANKAEEQALFKLENDWTQGVVKRDAAIMQRLTAPKWVYSDESGVMEREAGIKAFTTGSDTVREASNEKMRALVYDKSAVVIGVLVMKGRGPKGAFTNRYRYTDTWVKFEGRWQCVASQDYLMPSPKR
jgi:ketosteroid isomerase-like protein